MGQVFDSMNDDQKSAFTRKMERLGLSATALTHSDELRTGAARPGPTILSSDPDESHLPPTIVEVRDVAHFKELSGVPDAHYESRKYSDVAFDYPQPLDERRAKIVADSRNQCDLEYQLTDAELGDVRKAAHAYVMGNSAKVQSHEPVINAMLFPTRMAVFAGESIVVTKDNPLIIQGPNPVVLNYASIKVEDGGQIIVKVTADVNAQTFIQQ
ncbi:MAG TPA: hypothetical protein VF006_17540 [Longimicrobium sp.]